MPLLDELRSRLHRYEKEAEEIRPRLQQLDELIRSAKALLAEEERQGIQIPMIQTPTNGTVKNLSVPALVDELLVVGKPMRFAQMRDTVRERLHPDKTPIEVGKLVGAALSRAVDKGKAERVGRGLYRAKNGVVPI